MADAFGTVATPARKPYPWTEIFRCFQVALDPRKLVVAAAGILAMSLGWYTLSCMFVKTKPIDTAPEYSFDVVKKDFDGKKKADNSGYSDDEIRMEARHRFERDYAQYAFNYDLAGENGRIRSMPWNEYRGENPYLFISSTVAQPNAMWFNECWEYLKEQLPVMAEPLMKLFLPVVKFTDPNASLATRIYLFLVLVWNVLVWAFCGGVITRIAAVQLSGKDRVSIGQACNFVCKRYLSYALTPIVPVGVIGAVVVGLIVVGLICLIPILGDFVYGIIGIPLMIFGGIIMTILLIGLVGYPMMTSTLSTEGSDTFDALSRSYNYVFQAPWTYAWNWLVALAYGTVVTFFVVLVASLMVYLGKWAICQTFLTETTNQKPDYLFLYAPESFQWKGLLLQGSSELHGTPRTATHAFQFANPEAANAYIKTYRWWNWVGVGLTTFWLTAIFIVMLGFSYSFFWSVSVMIYLLMRQKVDEVEIDEVYLDDDETPLPPPPPPVVVTPSAPASLPMVTAPPPVVVPPPVALPTPPEAPKAADSK